MSWSHLPEAVKEGKSEAELDEMWWKKAGDLVSKYYQAREEVEKDVEGLKKFFRSQKDMPGKTKADIVKQIWAELPKHMSTPVAPLDEEMLSELAKVPAVVEGEFKHNWGTVPWTWQKTDFNFHLFSSFSELCGW